MMRVCLVAVTALLFLAGCEDGGHLFDGDLEPGPVVPAPPQAVTSPVELFTATPASDLPTPTADYGASGPAGAALVPLDSGSASIGETELEDSDVLVCDPDNDRIVHLKGRVRTAPFARVFASGSFLDATTALFLAQDRRVVATTSAGYTVLSEDGTTASPQAVAGGPFVAIAFSFTGGVLFLSNGSDILRMSADTDFAPTGSPATIVTGSSIRALALRRNGDLLFTEGNELRRVPSASTAGPNADVLVVSFGGDTPRGIVINSAGNAVVAVEGDSGDHRLDEVVIDTGTVASTLALAAAPRAVAIDGRHAAYTWTDATGVRQQIEPAPTLAERIATIFIDRACTGCHSPSQTFPLMDLTEDGAIASLVGVTNECDGASERVDAGFDPEQSFLVEKLDPDPSCGSRMPLSLRPIPTIEIDTIRNWISAGAPE